MSSITVSFGDSDNSQVSPQRVLREVGRVRLVASDRPSHGTAATVAITFPVQMPDGSVRQAECRTTYAALEIALGALRGRYGPGGFMDSLATRGVR